MARETFDYRDTLAEQIKVIDGLTGGKPFLSITEVMDIFHIGHTRAKKLPFVEGKISNVALASVFVRQIYKM